MVIEPMPDEFYERYRHVSHEELYTMLGAGSPQQVEELLTGWRSMETTISALSATLRSDLNRLREGWEGLAGQEFDNRVGLVSTYAQTLAAEYGAMHIGLLAMGSALAQALGQSEPPDATPPTTAGSANTGMAAGSVLGPVGTVVGAVIGGVMGHTKDEHAREAAKERMTLLTAGLAAEYRVAEFHIWPATVPLPPPGMPAARPVETTTSLAGGMTEERQRDERHRDRDQRGGDGPRGDHGPRPSPPPDMRPSQGPENDDPWGTSPAVLGAVGTGLVAGGVVAASGDRDSRGSHQHSQHDGPTKISLGDDGVSDGVVRGGRDWDGPDRYDGDHGRHGGFGHRGYDGPGVVGPGYDGVGMPGIHAVPDAVQPPSGLPTTPGVVPTGAGPTPGVTSGPHAHVVEATGREAPTSSALASGGTVGEGADGRATPPPPPTPPVAGPPTAPTSAVGTGGVTSTGAGTIGAAGHGASYTSPGYTASHGGAMPAGVDPTAGARGGDARSWMQEGRMSWRDGDEAPPPVLEEPTAE
jgi:uncharacterized protein YukE